MEWIELRRSKIRVYGKRGKLLPKGMEEEHTSFLHSLLTNDIKGMQSNTLSYNLWLKQNGFPIGEFFVYKLEDYYLLDTPLGAREVIEEFSRLKLSMRVYFEELSYEHLFVFGEGSGELVKELLGGSLEPMRVNLKDGLLVAHNPIRIKEEGYDLVGDLSAVREKLKGIRELSKETWERLRVERCVPLLGKELKEGFSPLETGVLSYAISLTKGCYVGQEAIARVYYRGRLPRVLALFEGKELREGERIRYEGKDVGVITSVAEGLALGYLLRASAEKSKSFFTQEGREIRLLRLCEG
ncbi:MAG: folate-binding protein [Acidobacteria bacterium]|nr:MAG: folate-binding protein [Acidobacteriota bacterium]